MSKCIELMNEINNNTEILLKKCDMNKCDPFIVEVWLVEILLKKVRYE